MSLGSYIVTRNTTLKFFPGFVVGVRPPGLVGALPSREVAPTSTVYFVYENSPRKIEGEIVTETFSASTTAFAHNV